MHSLKEYHASKVLVLVFTCNHCPVAQMYEKRIKQLISDYRDRGVAVVAISPNDPKAVRLSEMGHTGRGSTLAEMRSSRVPHFNFPYLPMERTQAVALKYGPTARPPTCLSSTKTNIGGTKVIDRTATASAEELINEARGRGCHRSAGRPAGP